MGDLLIHSSFLPPSLLPSYFFCFCFFHFLFCFLRFLEFCLPVLFEIFYFGCFPELVFILRIVFIMVSYYCVMHTIFLLCLSELLFKPFFEVLFCSLRCPPHSLDQGLAAPRWGRSLGIWYSRMSLEAPSLYLQCGLLTPPSAAPDVQSLSVLAFPNRKLIRKSVSLGSERRPGDFVALWKTSKQSLYA